MHRKFFCQDLKKSIRIFDEFLPKRSGTFGVCGNTLMKEAKNTARAVVHIGYDGRVHKTFKGPQARERYENEVRVLDFLQKHGCTFVPQIIEKDDSELYLVTSNCGKVVDHVSDDKKNRIFTELEQYGVRHDDAEVRNITYDTRQGRFCVIDFEFATILVPGYPPSTETSGESGP